MNHSPSKIDALLSNEPAGNSLARQGQALRDFLQDDSETREILQRLEAGIKSTLLGAGSLEELTSDHVLGALGGQLEQKVDDRQTVGNQAEGDHGDAHSSGRPARPLSTEGSRKRKAGANRGFKKNPRPEPGIASFSERLNGNNQSHSVDDTRASKKFDPVVVKPKKQGKQALSTALGNQPRVEGNSPSKIDASQASNSMAQRAAKAGMSAAWNSVVSSSQQHSSVTSSGENIASSQTEAARPMFDLPDPAHRDGSGAKSSNFDSILGAGKGIAQVSEGLTTAGEQLEQSLKNLMGNIHSKPGSASGLERTQSKSLPMAGHGQTHGLNSSRAEKRPLDLNENTGPASLDNFPGENGLQNRNAPGGLRGLVAQANKPLDDTESSIEAANPTRQRNNHLPVPGTGDQPVGSSRSPLTEIADLLAEEARRAGINLEQFRP